MIKHFAFNDQENHRGDGGIDRSVATWVGEQAAREIYLRPFEFCMHAPDVELTYYTVDESGAYTLNTTTIRAAQGMMTAFNRHGAVWAGGSYPLIQQLVRDEWGFDGFIITDSANSGSPAFDQSQMIRSGADAFLRSNENTYTYDPANSAEYHYAREAVHHLLYTTANCRAMNGAVPGSVYVPGMQPLAKIRIAATVIPAIIMALLAWTAGRNHAKRKKEREEA